MEVEDIIISDLPGVAKLPGVTSFIFSTQLGISLIVFAMTFLLLLYLRPPSIIESKLTGPTFHWLFIILISFVVALSVHIYPTFVRLLQ